MKHPSQSKTIWVNLIPLIISLNEIGISLFNNAKITYSMMAVAALSILNIILRFFTSESIKKVPVIIAALLLTSCSSVQQKLEPDVFYKRDIGLEVNGQFYSGVTVIPKSSHYSITIIPPGDTDLVLFQTCHRENAIEKASKGWGLFGKKSKFTYEYYPVSGIEDSRVCPLRVNVFDSKNGKNAWALLDFEHPLYQLKFNMTCNGEEKQFNGVGICQAKNKSIQRIMFKEPVMFAPSNPGCNDPIKTNSWYEIKGATGECLYMFKTESGVLGRLTLLSYEGVLVREAQ